MANIQLKKTLYGIKGALDKLDEEFGEFALQKRTPAMWFKMWDDIFYDIHRNTHRYFLFKSQKYAFPEGYINPRETEIEDLKKSLLRIQRQIDELERSHFFFQNNSFIMKNNYDNNASTGIANQQCYFMQSGKKRKITGGAIDGDGDLITPTTVYNNLKTRRLKQTSNITNEQLIIFVGGSTFSGISEGPDLMSLNDIHLSPIEINIYPRTLEEYNNLTFEQMFPQLITNTPGMAIPNRI